VAFFAVNQVDKYLELRCRLCTNEKQAVLLHRIAVLLLPLFHIPYMLPGMDTYFSSLFVLLLVQDTELYYHPVGCPSRIHTFYIT